MVSRSLIASTVVAFIGLLCAQVQIVRGRVVPGQGFQVRGDLLSALSIKSEPDSDALADSQIWDEQNGSIDDFFESSTFGKDGRAPADSQSETDYDYVKLITFAEATTSTDATPDMLAWADLGAAILNIFYSSGEHAFSQNDVSGGTNADRFYAFAFLGALEVNKYLMALYTAYDAWEKKGSRGSVPTVGDIVKSVESVVK